MSPPPTAFVLCARLCPPPKPSFACGPVKGACPPSFDLTLSSSLLLSLSSSSLSSFWALTYYAVAITTSLDAPLPLSLCRRLYRHAAATIAAPTPVSLRLSLVPAVGCYIVTSLAAPVPLLLCWRLVRYLTMLLQHTIHLLLKSLSFHGKTMFKILLIRSHFRLGT